MSVWVEAQGNPLVAFYNTSLPQGPVLPDVHYPTLMDVGEIRSPLGVGGGNEAANCSFTITNDDGAMTEVAADLMFVMVSIKRYSNGQTRTIFTGRVDRISGGGQITFTLVG